MVDLIDVNSHILVQTLRQTAKFPIKIIAATDDESAVYAKEREKLEKQQRILIIDHPAEKDEDGQDMKKFIQTILDIYRSTVTDTIEKFNKFDDDKSGSLDTDELAKLLTKIGIEMDD